MKSLWSITFDDYFEIVRRAKEAGIKEGESMEEVFIKYMEEQNKKPIGATELSMDEMLKEQASHGKSVLGIETDKEGKTKYKIVKKKEEEL
jgi:hypothetical protein